MEKDAKIAKLKEFLAPVIESHGAFLVDLSVRGSHRRPILEVFCETESGISIDKCAEISRDVLPLIDSSKLFGDDFRLEVSSPGIGVPLKDKRQYKRSIGKLISIRYRVPQGPVPLTGDSAAMDELKQIEGEIVDVSEDKVKIATGDESVEIPFDSIVEGKVKVRW
jgi:ribosome maturation factor RimP